MGVCALGGVIVLAFPVGPAVIGVGGVVRLGVDLAPKTPHPTEVVRPVQAVMQWRFGHCSPPPSTKFERLIPGQYDLHWFPLRVWVVPALLKIAVFGPNP